MGPIRPSLLVIGCAWTFMGCARSPAGGERQPVATGHWIHDERLRVLMIGMDRAANENWPQELQGDLPAEATPGAAQMEEAMLHAHALAETARCIPQAVPSTRLAEVDRRSFDAQAATLMDQAERLERAAQANDAWKFRAVLADIDATCRSCHTRFRDLAGPVGDR